MELNFKLIYKKYMFMLILLAIFSSNFIFIAVSNTAFAENSTVDDVFVKFHNIDENGKSQNESSPKTLNGHGLGHNYNSLKVKPSLNLSSSSLSLPSSYDLRNIDGNSYVSKVKNQGDYGTCWSFGTIAAIESNLIKSNLASPDIDLSEWHLAYFNYYQNDNLGDPLSNRYDNPRGNYYRGTYGDGNRVKDYLNNGGNELDASYTLANGKGLANESDFNYNEVLQDSTKTIAPEYAYSSSSGYNLDDSYFVSSSDTQKIKQYLMTYGAASISFYCGSESDVQKYYNDKTAAHYCYDDIPCSHTVTLVGWDDSYSADNFTNKPSTNGAWIAKNSWGEDWGNNGYFYLSYEDKSFINSGTVYFISARKAKDGEKNYQYDGNGTSLYTEYQIKNDDGSIKSANKIYESNVFFADSNDQKLSSISLGIFNTDVKVNAWIYTDLKNKTNPTSGEKKQVITNKAISDMGYYTLDLDNNSNVNILANSWFSIVVSIETTLADDYVCIPISATVNDTNYVPCEYISKANGTEGYIATENSDGSIGIFYDVNNIKTANVDEDLPYEISNCTLRIKAQTVPQKITISAPAHTGGTVKLSDGSTSVDGKFTVDYGKDVTFNIIADSHSGYEISNLLVDSQALGIQNTYTLKNVTRAHTIDAIFRLKDHVVKITSDKNGMLCFQGKSISNGSMSIDVEHGSNPTVTVVPYSIFNNHKIILDGTIDITNEISNNTYTLSQVENGHTIDASFILKENDTSINNGIYSIVSTTDNLSVMQSSTEKLQLNKSSDILSQRFTLTKLPDGSYSLTSQFSGNVLEATSDTQISESVWNDKDSQKWLIIKNSENNYTFVSKLNSNCITVSNQNAELCLAVSCGNSSQMFSLQEDSDRLSLSTNEYLIINKAFKNKAISTKNSSNSIILRPSNGSKAQIFTPVYMGCGYYSFIAKSSGKVLEIENNSDRNETHIIQNNFNYSSNQLWRLQNLNNGYYNIISKSNDKCLSVSKNSNSNLQIYQDNQSDYQQFKLLEIYNKNTKISNYTSIYDLFSSLFSF